MPVQMGTAGGSLQSSLYDADTEEEESDEGKRVSEFFEPVRKRHARPNV